MEDLNVAPLGKTALKMEQMEDLNVAPLGKTALKMVQMKGLNVVLLGKTRAGKSSTGNTILGRPAFKSKKSSRSVARDVAVESGSVGYLPVTVYDAPELFDTEMSEDEIQKKYEELFQKCESGPCVFLLVIKADRFTKEERETVEKIEKMLGEERLKKTWILFTRGDELEEEDMTIQEFLDENEKLKQLFQKYDQRYHVFNNKAKGQAGQVQMLFLKLFMPYFDKLEIEDTEILKQDPRTRKIPQEIKPDTPADSLPSRRIVLLGKSGVGKSAAANTILGQREFTSLLKMDSVTSECSAAQTIVSGTSVCVVDTPGLFDTQMKEEELAEEIARSVYLSCPGPHAFLIVFPVNMRFTKQEQQIPQVIEMMFGQEVLKYSIILFTHGDQLENESVEKLIEESSKLRDLVEQCGGRYHIFNNKDQNNRQQVNDLLQKIDSMIEQNGGGHYSNQMYEDALTFRREEEEQRQRDEEQRKQQEEKKVQEEIERVRKETEERIRAEMKAQAERQSEEEQRKQEKQRKEELERLIKETEDRVRKQQKQEKKKDSGFMKFFSRHRQYFLWGAVIVGVAFGGAALGALAGAAVAKALTGAAVAKAIGVAVGGVAGGAAAGAVAGAVSGEGAAKGAAVGAVAGVALVGAIGGAVAGAAAATALTEAAAAEAVGIAVGGVVGGAAGGASAGAVAGAVSGEGAAAGAAAGAVVGVAAGGAVAGGVLGAAVASETAVAEVLSFAAGGVVGGTAAGAAAGAVAGAASGEGAAVGAAAGAAVGAAAGAAVGGAFAGVVTGGALGGSVSAKVLGVSVGGIVGGGVGGGAAGAAAEAVASDESAAGAQ